MRALLLMFVVGVMLSVSAFAQPSVTVLLAPDDTARIWIGQPDSVTFYFYPRYEPVFSPESKPCRGIKPLSFEPVQQTGIKFDESRVIMPQTMVDGEPCGTAYSRFGITVPLTVKREPGLIEISARLQAEDRNGKTVFRKIDQTYSLPVMVKRPLDDPAEKMRLITGYLQFDSQDSVAGVDYETLRVVIEPDVPIATDILKFPGTNRYYLFEHTPSPAHLWGRLKFSEFGWIGATEVEFKLEKVFGPEGIAGGHCRARLVDGQWTDFVFVMQYAS